MGIRSDQYGGIPGITAAVETYESEYTFGRWGVTIPVGFQIDGAARDSGNSLTSVLRTGLILGQIASSGNLTNWSATAVDGSNRVYGILAWPIRMTDLDANNTNRFVPVTIAGPVQASKLIGLTAEARVQMRGRFIFDDDPGNKGFYRPWQVEIPKITAYSVLASDNGTLFTTTGAVGSVLFTLPALAPGLMFEFMAVADFTMTVASLAGDDIVTSNDTQADSVGFATGGDIIGGHVRIYSNMAGTRWYMEKLCANAMTIVS